MLEGTLGSDASALPVDRSAPLERDIDRRSGVFVHDSECHLSAALPNDLFQHLRYWYLLFNAQTESGISASSPSAASRVRNLTPSQDNGPYAPFLFLSTLTHLDGLTVDVSDAVAHFNPAVAHDGVVFHDGCYCDRVMTGVRRPVQSHSDSRLHVPTHTLSVKDSTGPHLHVITPKGLTPHVLQVRSDDPHLLR